MVAITLDEWVPHRSDESGGSGGEGKGEWGKDPAMDIPPIFTLDLLEMHSVMNVTTLTNSFDPFLLFSPCPTTMTYLSSPSFPKHPYCWQRKMFEKWSSSTTPDHGFSSLWKWKYLDWICEDSSPTAKSILHCIQWWNWLPVIANQLAFFRLSQCQGFLLQ